jgi:hypothetical protein
MATVLDYYAAATPRKLQVSAGIGVDFHADGDLNDARCFPSRGISPGSWTKDDVEDTNAWHTLRTRWHVKPLSRSFCSSRIIAAGTLQGNLWMVSI